MKLNAKGLEELRIHILKMLETVPEGERIKLDKELLDDLIFFKGKNKKGEVIKVPIWTGQFLRKLDLSELSFKNVYFGIGNEIYDHTDESIEKIMDAEPVERFRKYYSNAGQCFDYVPPVIVNQLKRHMLYIIDFSYTNINVNFKEIYGDAIECTNFSGVDLSKSNASSIKWAYKCNFSNTNLKLDFSINDDELGLNNCDFSFNNFEGQTLDSILLEFDKNQVYSNGVNNCIFWNTGLSIDSLNDESKTTVAKLIKKNNLNGCYVNGVYIKNIEERKAVAAKKYEEYLEYQKSILSSIESRVENQTRKRKK